MKSRQRVWEAALSLCWNAEGMQECASSDYGPGEAHAGRDFGLHFCSPWLSGHSNRQFSRRTPCFRSFYCVSLVIESGLALYSLPHLDEEIQSLQLPAPSSAFPRLHGAQSSLDHLVTA